MEHNLTKNEIIVLKALEKLGIKEKLVKVWSIIKNRKGLHRMVKK